MHAERTGEYRRGLLVPAGLIVQDASQRKPGPVPPFHTRTCASCGSTWQSSSKTILLCANCRPKNLDFAKEWAAVESKVRYWIRTAIGNWDIDAEDLQQQVALNALAAIGRFRNEAEFSTFVNSVVFNTAASYKRKACGRRRHETQLNEEQAALPAEERNAEDVLVRRAHVASAVALIACVRNVRRRKLLEQVYIVGLSLDELSALYGCEKPVISRRLWNAHRDLRELAIEQGIVPQKGK